VLLGALVAGSVLASAAGWVGLAGWRTRGHLTAAADLATSAAADLRSGHTARARATLVALQRQTAAARRRTDDPGWSLASRAPTVGDDLTAVRQVAVAVDDLARRVLPGLLEIDPATVLPQPGRVDPVALRRTAPRLTAAADAVAQVRSRLGRVTVAGLLPPTRRAVQRLRSEVDRLAEVTAVARVAATLLPPLLGADGPRTYLLVFQNLAEVRATGGLFGAYAAVRVADGRAAIVRQGSMVDLKAWAEPVLPLDGDTVDLYTDLVGTYPNDVNLTPHFPTAAALFRQMYLLRGGTRVDGVLATDPVVLSYLLRVVGPVEVPHGGRLTADTAVRALLSEAYLRLPDRAQDRYFAAAARAVFDALLRRPADPAALAGVLQRALAERRLLFWSARPDEQAVLAGTRLAGDLPDREDTPTVGVFLNDGSGAKLGYYLTRAAALTVGACRADGRRDLRLRVTLGSTAPRAGLTASVLGLGMSGEPYTLRTLVYVVSPVAGAVVRVRLDGRPAPAGAGLLRGRRVGVLAVDLPPGRTRVIEADLLTPVTRDGAVDLRLTPGVTPWTTQVEPARTCEQ
jgi:hypothetical protein